MAYKDLKGNIYQGPHEAPEQPTGKYTDGDGCLEDFVNLVGNEITTGCMIPMNVPKDQVKRMVKQAKKWFYKNYEDSVRENFYYLPAKNFKTDDFKKTRSFHLPNGDEESGANEIISVHGFAQIGDAQFTGITGKKEGVDRDFSLERNLNGELQGGDVGLALESFTIHAKMLDLARELLVNKIGYEYNRLTHVIKVLGETPTEDVVMRVYETIPDCQLYEDEIFFRYVVAQVKIAIGRMIMTFGYSLPGNVTINGDMIKEDGNEELTGIKEEIKGDEGIDFFMHS
tara:strand:- start:20273 stop:21127 length:855 start_codon:yes stop_codon:yes gene_type:complete